MTVMRFHCIHILNCSTILVRPISGIGEMVMDYSIKDDLT